MHPCLKTCRAASFGYALIVLAPLASAQIPLPWSEAASIPVLAASPDVALYYAASYGWSGTHTNYDMARQAADAYLAANPTVPTYLILPPGTTQTCDDLPLPAVAAGAGASATVSVLGYGSNVSILLKRAGCGSAAATLEVSGVSGGAIRGATFQGFTVNANHLDAAACGFYGTQNSTVFDVACGNALPGADHELEFGSVQNGMTGEDSNLSLYNLKAFDSVGTGKGAEILPSWNGTGLDGGVLVSGGSKAYTVQYTRAQLIGPGLGACTALPKLAVQVAATATSNYSNLPAVQYGRVTGVTVLAAGLCASPVGLSLLIQDGVPVTYGMKFTNLNMSHAWNLESTASAQYAEAWLPQSSNNTIFGEHPYTNQTIQILDEGNANKHTSTLFDGPGAYGAEIAGRSGHFIDPVFVWDSATYLGSSGYLFAAVPGGYNGWTIQNSQCTNSLSGFLSVVTSQGVLAPGAPPPAGITLTDVEACDGSTALNWPTQVTAP